VSRRLILAATALVALAAPSAAAAACPTAPLSPAALTGFEHGRLGYSIDNLVPSGTGASVTSAAARNGAYGLRIAANGSAGNEYFMWSSYIHAGVARFAMRLDSLPSSTVSELFRMDTYAKSVLRIGYSPGTGSLRLNLTSASGATETVDGPAVAAGTWYVINVRYDSGGPHVADWSVDGVAQPSASVAGEYERQYTARWGTTTNDRFTAHYDDVLASMSKADYTVGDGRVQVLRPNGSTATSNALRDNDGTAIDASSWTRLDEIPATSTTDFIQQTTASSSAYAQIAFEDTPEPCARAVRGYLTTHSASTTNNANAAKLSFFDGGRESVIKSGDWAANTTVSRDYSETVTPAADWSQAALNGLVARFGYATDVKPVPMLDGVLVEYEVPLS
jgi:hypothetical protein